MLPIETILHPTDFSKRSEHAFKLSCALARDYNARLVLLHVVEPPFVHGELGAPIEIPESHRHATMERLQQLRPADPNLVVEHSLREGPVADVILWTAKETQCDLIVLGTHGRTGLSRVLMGSAAEEILRKAECPVLIVKMPFHGEEELPESKVAGTAEASS